MDSPAPTSTAAPRLLSPRFWNIALRSAHLATTGVLLGGHFYNLPPERLLPPLAASVATGLGLAALEAGPRLLWFHQGRGLMTLGKLALLLLVPWFWSYRFPILLAVVALGSVGSHMPARIRYYSVWYREVIRCGDGPGVNRLPAASPTENGLQ